MCFLAFPGFSSFPDVQMAAASRAAARPGRAAAGPSQASGLAQFGKPPSQARPGGRPSGMEIWDNAVHCTIRRVRVRHGNAA